MLSYLTTLSHSLAMASGYGIHLFIAILMVILALVFLCVIFPVYCIFKFIFYLCSFFTIENMKGKVVVITGASSGIGEQLAYEYAKREAFLVIVARRESQLKKVAEKARIIGSPDVLPVCADVSKEEDCKWFIEEAVKHFGRLDHVVNNAGIASVFLVGEAVDISKYTSVMDVNFWGSVYPTFYAMPHLRRTRGRIVVNTSCTAFLQPPGLSFYAASKSALTSFYECLRHELAPEISITIAILGFVDSEMTRGKHLSNEGTVKVDPKIGDITDLHPVMTSSDCAKSIVNVACRGGRYVTEPKYYGTLMMLRSLCPELAEWYYSKILLPYLTVTGEGFQQPDANTKSRTCKQT